MEEAEEERRRRALEERRRTQREATERCKMAISRLRLSSRTSSSTTTNSRQRHMPVESESINACVFHFRVLRKLNTIIMCISFQFAQFLRTHKTYTVHVEEASVMLQSSCVFLVYSSLYKPTSASWSRQTQDQPPHICPSFCFCCCWIGREGESGSGDTG